MIIPSSSRRDEARRSRSGPGRHHRPCRLGFLRPAYGRHPWPPPGWRQRPTENCCRMRPRHHMDEGAAPERQLEPRYNNRPWRQLVPRYNNRPLAAAGVLVTNRISRPCRRLPSLCPMIAGRLRSEQGKTAVTPIPAQQNRTKYPPFRRVSLIVGQNWRYSPRMTRDHENKGRSAPAYRDRTG